MATHLHESNTHNIQNGINSEVITTINNTSLGGTLTMMKSVGLGNSPQSSFLSDVKFPTLMRRSDSKGSVSSKRNSRQEIIIPHLEEGWLDLDGRDQGSTERRMMERRDGLIKEKTKRCEIKLTDRKRDYLYA